MTGSRACPILPAKDLGATRSYYEALGFEVQGDIREGYMLMTRGPWELHFFYHPEVKPEDSLAGVYMRGVDVDALCAEWAKVELSRAGIPRLIGAQDKPWGMREFALIDPNGTLLRIGQAA